MKNNKQTWLRYVEYESYLHEMAQEEKPIIRKALKAEDVEVFSTLNDGGFVFAVRVYVGKLFWLVVFDCNGILLYNSDNPETFEDDNGYVWNFSGCGLYLIGIYNSGPIREQEILSRGFRFKKSEVDYLVSLQQQDTNEQHFFVKLGKDRR